MVCVFSLTYVIPEQIICNTLFLLWAQRILWKLLSLPSSEEHFYKFTLWASQIKLFSSFVNEFPGVVNIDRLMWNFSWLVEVLLLHFVFSRELYQSTKERMPDCLSVFGETGCFVELRSSVPCPWQSHKEFWTLEEAHACTADIFFFFQKL